MPSDQNSKRVELMSISHAIDVGYAVGKALHDKGTPAVEEGTHMRSWGDEHLTSPYVMWWNRGFEAGFHGRDKPVAS